MDPTKGPTFKCTCPIGYQASFCEIAVSNNPCTNSPCKNGGVCKEGYDHFDCDCRWTPFKGPICADEIGVNMRTNYMVKYDFKGNYKSTIAEKIHVGFTTTDPKGFLIGAYR